MNDLLLPKNLETAANLDHAVELVSVMLTATDGDVIADALDVAANDADLAHAVMYFLVTKLKGWAEERTGVELVAATYRPAALFLVGDA